MPPQILESLRSEPPNADVISLEFRRFEAERRSVADRIADVSEALARTDARSERDRLARDIADIERATVTLRKAVPNLQSWTRPPAALPGEPRSVWLLITVLWISTALIASGAVVAIATLAG